MLLDKLLPGLSSLQITLDGRKDMRGVPSAYHDGNGQMAVRLQEGGSKLLQYVQGAQLLVLQVGSEINHATNFGGGVASSQAELDAWPQCSDVLQSTVDHAELIYQPHQQLVDIRLKRCWGICESKG